MTLNQTIIKGINGKVDFLRLNEITTLQFDNLDESGMNCALTHKPQATRICTINFDHIAGIRGGAVYPAVNAELNEIKQALTTYTADYLSRVASAINKNILANYI